MRVAPGGESWRRAPQRGSQLRGVHRIGDAECGDGVEDVVRRQRESLDYRGRRPGRVAPVGK